MLKPWKQPQSHEDLFLQRYDWLLNWALQLTGHNREQAEDLVQDAFIQFTLSRPELNSINNLEGYLYGMLRNLHLSQVRRAARIKNQPLSIIEYDSAEIGLRTTDTRNQMRARDELRVVCDYACARKEKSRAGSVLLLRFFHGYYPNEIAGIMQSPRRAADDWLRIARREAKSHLENPQRLFIAKDRFAPAQTDNSWPADEFLTELRNAIFHSRQGDCYSHDDLAKVYDGLAPVDCRVLAHIVSCPVCLENVNRILRLPPMSDRFPTDTIGPDVQPRSGLGDAGPKSGGLLKRLRRGSTEIFEHRPKELRISVNGFILGSQTLGSELNEQVLNVSLPESIGFVEIFSEQDLRLLFLNVDAPPEGAVDQPAVVELSEGRTLEVNLSFDAPWPRLHAAYHDPAAATLAEAVPIEEGFDENKIPLLTETTSQNSFENVWSQFVRKISQLGSLFSPMRVTAVLAMLLIAVAVSWRLTHETPVSAAELLRKATEIENVTSPNVTVHRTINLEERSRPDGTLIARRRIEVWLSPSKGPKAKRIYDENNRLIAAEWIDADGSRNVYDRDAKPPVRRTTEPRSGFGIESGASWQIELSASDFATMIGRTESGAVSDRGNSYLIEYQTNLNADAPSLVRAMIRLNKRDLHPIEQILWVRRQGREVEYKLTEESYENVPASKVSPSTFEIDPDLVGREGRRLDTTHPSADLNLTPPNAPVPLSAAALAELRLDILFQLHKVGACIREQATVVRKSSGELQVQAIVDDQRRKDELLGVLGSVPNPVLKTEILTVAEAASQSKRLPNVPTVVRRVEFAKDRIPVHAELQRYFQERAGRDPSTDERKSSNGHIEEDIRQLAKRALTLSRQEVLQAWALKHHAEEMSNDELAALTPDALAKWRSMVRQHAVTLLQQIRGLRAELEPIFLDSSTDESGANDQDDISDELQIIGRLFALATAHEESVRKAFAISSESSATLAVKTEQFWRSLRSAERLATRIRAR